MIRLFALFYTLIGILSLVHAQHSITTAYGNTIFCSITGVSDSAISFKHTRNNKEYTLLRKEIKNIRSFGLDTSLLISNFALAQPFEMNHFQFNDKITLNFGSHYEFKERIYKTLEAKVLAIEDGSLFFLCLLDGEYIHDQISIENIEVVNYSTETKSYVLNRLSYDLSSDKDKIIMNNGKILDVYIYEINANGIKYSETDMGTDLQTYSKLKGTQWQSEDGLKYLSHEVIISLSLVNGHVYYPQIKINLTKKNNLPKQEKTLTILVDIGGSAGKTLFPSPGFQNNIVADELTINEDAAKKLNFVYGLKADVGFLVSPKLSLELGYEKQFSNTIKTYQNTIESSTSVETRSYVNYQNNVNLFLFGVGYHKNNTLFRAQAVISTANNNIFWSQSEFQSFELKSKFTVDGLYKVKPGLGYSFILGRKMTFKGISYTPYLNYGSYAMKTKSITIKNVSVEGDETPEPNTYSYNQFEELGYFYVPKSYRIHYLSAGILLTKIINSAK